jgi:hypothetical protein
MDSVPNNAFDTFKPVNEAPEPTKLEGDKVLFILSHIIFGVCKIDSDFEPLPINS